MSNEFDAKSETAQKLFIQHLKNQIREQLQIYKTDKTVSSRLQTQLDALDTVGIWRKTHRKYQRRFAF